MKKDNKNMIKHLKKENISIRNERRDLLKLYRGNLEEIWFLKEEDKNNEKRREN